MKHRTRLAATAAAGTALALGGLAPAWAADITIRSSDLLAGMSDTRAQGTVEFLADGLHVATGEDTATPPAPPNDKAAEYWERNGALPGSASLVWNGSPNRPTIHLVFDTDSDRTNEGSRNVLASESGADWAYVGGLTQAQSRGIDCPESDVPPDSDCHGTLAQWTTSLADEELWAVGFSMEGVVGDGVIRSLTVGPDTYEFTNSAAPGPDPVVAPVRGYADAVKKPLKRKAVVRMWTDPMGAGEVQGRKARFFIYVDGRRVFAARKGEDTSARWSRKFAKRTGKHVVQVFVNGSLVDVVRIKTGKPRRR